MLWMDAQCSRLMYFIRGSVLHVWLNLTGRKALGQFFWHFKNARAGIGGLCLCETMERQGEKGYSLLCLLMMVWSLRRQDADGPREYTAGVRRAVKDALQGNALLGVEAGVMSPTFMTAAVIHTSLPFGFLVSTKLPFFPFCTNAQKCIIYEEKCYYSSWCMCLHMYAQANDKAIWILDVFSWHFSFSSWFSLFYESSHQLK